MIPFTILYFCMFQEKMGVQRQEREQPAQERDCQGTVAWAGFHSSPAQQPATGSLVKVQAHVSFELLSATPD